MWRAAITIRRPTHETHALRSRMMLSHRKLSMRVLSPSSHQMSPSCLLHSSNNPTYYPSVIRRALSSTSLDDNASSSEETPETLEEVLLDIEQQAMDDERLRSITNPTPWFSLLHYPSRAAWRSSDHMLGAKNNQSSSQYEDDSNVSGSVSSSPLSQTQFNLLQHSEKTNKQLKRTYKRIMDTHKSLALKRERERRQAANLSNPKTLLDELRDSKPPEGSIKDGQGRHVGDWTEKPTTAPASLSDDPSVALALSMGISNSQLRSTRKAGKLAKSKDVSTTATEAVGGSSKSKEKPVGYGPEQTLTNIRYRLGPNYSIVRRVLEEVQSLLGGKPSDDEEGSDRRAFRPKRVLDFGSGVGSSSAAALDVFGVSRSADTNSDDNSSSKYHTDKGTNGGIDWVHSIDASQCMREATETVLKSLLEDAPWDSEEMQQEEDMALEEELAEYERIISGIKGSADERKLERQRKRLQKWERTWTKLTNYRTRLTFGESIVDSSSFYANKVDRGDDRPALPWQQQLDEQRRKTTIQKKAQNAAASQQQQQGTFDLILCSYTLSELPNVPSSLSAAALLWEKLAPNGVLVFVEPGTPDGFSTLRSVRSMLLECSAPPEVREKRRKAAEARAAAAVRRAENGQGELEEEEEEMTEADDSWHEECYVIAPCTHNGTCPMSRHQRHHIKRNTKFGKYEATIEQPNEGEGEENEEEERREEKETWKGYLGDWNDMDGDEREEMKMMVGAGDMSDEEMEEMLKLADKEDDDEDEQEEDSDSDEEEDVDDEPQDDEEYHDIVENREPSSNKNTSRIGNMAQTHVFDHSFCSFVHNFPGGTSRKRGEKFSYLVVQKRVPDSEMDNDENNDSSTTAMASTEQEDFSLDEVDVVEMLSKSVYHSNQLKVNDLRKRKEQKLLNSLNGKQSKEETAVPKTYDTHHQDQSHDILQKAVEVEEEFLDSTIDSLGLELLSGDDRRKGWGRLIRAPLKRKGHVYLDYCSAGCGGCSKSKSNDFIAKDGHDLPNGTQGRITRHKVSRGWASRAAPGSYSAARKARWGGLWPDLSERVKLAESEDFTRKVVKKKIEE